MSTYLLGTCIMAGCSVVYMGAFDTFPLHRSLSEISGSQKKRFKEPNKRHRKRLRKPLKAEAKAQALLRDMIGYDQWRIYRKTNRIIVKPNNHFWMIGDVFGDYNKSSPFTGKPDVVRIDNAEKLYATNFCAIQLGGEKTPYSDQVMFFALSLISDEKRFAKTVNRINEKKFKKMKECAVWNVGELR